VLSTTLETDSGRSDPAKAGICCEPISPRKIQPSLIRKWLKAGILEGGVVTVADSGTGKVR
jgi:hypothetical protein